jgi:hypothetical protein
VGVEVRVGGVGVGVWGCGGVEVLGCGGVGMWGCGGVGEGGATPTPTTTTPTPTICRHFDSKFDSSRHGRLPTMTKVVALEFSRSPQWFFDCLVSGEALDKHRSAMLAVGRPCFFGDEGAKLLVSPEEVNDVLMHLSSAGVMFEDKHFSWDELRARHVIVSEALEDDVLTALAESPGSGKDGGKGRDHVRVKRRAVIDIPKAAWHSQADEGFELYSLSF